VAAQIFNLGKLRFSYKSTYNGSTTYQLNDVVKYQNDLYVYINSASSSGNLPTNLTYWEKMVEGFSNPSEGTNGQFVQTNGTSFVYANVSQVPAQTGQSGKFLTTNGTTASWSDTFGQLSISGDLDVGTTTGELYVGTDARSDAETIGTSIKTVSTKALTNNVVTITTSSSHGFSSFQFVTIALSPADSTFDGTYEITSTPTATTFTYDKTASNVSAQATGGTASAIPGYTNAAAVFAIDADSDFAQIAFRNSGDGANSSTDIIVYPDNGTDFAGWFSHGVTSSNFSDPEFTITGPNDAYLFYDAPVGTSGAGNLVIATGDKGSQNKIIFAAGGLSSDNEQMSITPDVNVHIEIPTPSTSPTTGAFTVVGGVGIQGDMNIQGDVAIEGTITFGGSGTTVETSNLAVTDPAVFVGTNNQSDIVDLSFIGEYATTVSPIVRSINNKALTSNVATLTTSAAHTYAEGDVVTITGVDATFNGTYNIKTVPTATTFTYAKAAGNVSSTAVSPVGTSTVGARRRFAGIARDATDGIIKVFRDATTKPVSTVNFSEAGLTYATVKMGGAEIGSVTNTEIGYLSGVTSSIQTQLNSKASAIGTTFTRSVFNTVYEGVTIAATALTGTVNIDLYSSGQYYYTSNAAANWTFNLRGDGGSNSINSMLSVGQTLTCSILVTQGATPYYPTAIQVDGVAVTTGAGTLRWQGGIAPTAGNNNSIDVYNFTIVKTGNASFIVLATQSKF
jgi:hypothetical protein